MRVKHRHHLTNGEVDAFIAERWRAGDNARGIMLELMWRGTRLSRERILAGIKRHIEANSENSGSGKKLPALDVQIFELFVLPIVIISIVIIVFAVSMVVGRLRR